jgi:glycosyltransferase involved in cell wall biosynthesis
LLAPAEAQDWRWRLLCLGRLDRRKGAHVALAALRHLPEARLAIVGAGDAEYEGELRAQAVRDGLTDRVTFGHVGRGGLRAAYAEADALVFPTLWEEPWGLVPLEAMAVGRPVVATGTGGSREYLRDGLNCLIYQPRDDAEALASAIRRLAGDEELRSRVRRAGIETASRYPSSAYDEAIRIALERVAAR